MANQSSGTPQHNHVMKVSGLNPKTTEDLLTNFLEAKTKQDVGYIRYSDDRCTALVTFLGEPDREAVEKVLKTKLGGRFLDLSAIKDEKGCVPEHRPRTEPLYNTRMIKVSGLNPVTSQDDLVNYLEAYADTDVEEVEWGSDRGTAFVTLAEEPEIAAIQERLKRRSRRIGGIIPVLSTVERPTVAPTSVNPGLTEWPQWNHYRTVPELPSIEFPKWNLGRTSPEPEIFNADWFAQTSTKQTEMSDPGKEVGEMSKKQITLTDHVSDLVRNSIYAKTFIYHVLQKWKFEVDGMAMKPDIQKGVDKTRFKYYEKKHTGSTYDGLTPSQALAVMRTEFPVLCEKVFIHGDDNEGKLYLMGETESVSEALRRLQVTIRNRALNISGKVHFKMALTNEEQMKFQTHDHNIRRIERENVEMELSREVLEISGDSVAVPSVRHKIPELMVSGPKVDIVHTTEHLKVKEPTRKGCIPSESSMLYSINIAVTELMATTLTKNTHIQTYVVEKFKELGFQFHVKPGNTVVLTTAASTTLEKAQRLFSRLVIETEFNWESEPVCYLKSLDSIKDVLLTNGAFQNKVYVIFSDKPRSLTLVCTNDILPSVEYEMETLRDSYKSTTLDIPRGIDVTMTECEESIRAEKGIKGKVKVLVDSENRLTICSHCTDADCATKAVEQVLRQKELEHQKNRRTFLSVSPSTLDYVQVPEEVEDFDTQALFHFGGDHAERPSDHHALSKRSSSCMSGEDEFLSVVMPDVSEIQSSEDFGELLDGGVEKKPLKKPLRKPQKKTIYENLPEWMQSIESRRKEIRVNTTKPNKPSAKAVTTNNPGNAQGKQLIVKAVKADITKLDVDVIVGSSNGLLAHSAGVSRAIADAAGPGLTRECNSIVSRRGQINVTEIAVTSAGRLPYKKVFHAVGPMWDDYTDKRQCLDDLCYTILRCLCQAESLKVKSMALSSISSGIFRVPLESCVKMYIRAVRSFEAVVNIQSLKEVMFVDVIDKVISEIQRQLDQMLVCPFEEQALKKDAIFIKTCLSGSSMRDTNLFKTNAHSLASGNDGDGDCAICLSKIRQAKGLPCGHTFCSYCINRALQEKKSCPVCLVPLENPVTSLVLVPESVLCQLSGLSGKTDSNCAICLDKMAGSGNIRQAKQLPCGHTFCTYCINRVLQEIGSCPVCLLPLEDNATCLVPDTVLSGLFGKSDSNCVICLDKMVRPKRIECGHYFCRECIDQSFRVRPVCPICYTVCGIITGYMPPGEMNVEFDDFQSLPGFEGDGIIVIEYIFQDGIQTEDHPNPGMRYTGCQHTAYLPNNRDGQRILSLLQVAWERRLIFTIETDTVIWNDISHKTNISGGPQNDGYPDTVYLRRVEEELVRVGVTKDDLWQ